MFLLSIQAYSIVKFIFIPELPQIVASDEHDDCDH